MSLIETLPDSFKGLDLAKAKSLPLTEKERIFHSLAYPESTWWFHNVIGIGGEQKLPMEDRLLFLKHLCENDLYYFAKFILKKNKIREFPNRDMAEAVMIRKNPNGQERKLLVEPRETYKTTVVTHALPVWHLVKNRDISILIYSETDKQAQELYQSVKEEMEMNELLQMIWGNFKSDRWNETRLFVRGRKQIRRDPSLGHAGNDSSVNGVHPDIAILDDICSDKNTQTLDQRDKVWDNYRLLAPLVQKNGEIISVCTRWCDDDFADRVIKNEKSLYSIISVKSAEDIRPNGKLYGEDIGLTKSILDQKRLSLGFFRYSANYLNKPVPDADQSFKTEWMNYFDGEWPVEQYEEGERRKSLGVYMAVDASWADRNSQTGKDPTAIVVLGFDHNGNTYLLDLFNKRIPPSEVVEEIFALVKKWQPLGVASEHIGTQKGINEFIQNEMSKRGVWFNLVLVKHQHTSKGGRIRALEPLFSTRSFFLKHHFEREFMEQYKLFNPHHMITNDDILDALEMGVSEFRQVAVSQNEEQANEEYEETYRLYDPDTGRM